MKPQINKILGEGCTEILNFANYKNKENFPIRIPPRGMNYQPSLFKNANVSKPIS